MALFLRDYIFLINIVIVIAHNHKQHQCSSAFNSATHSWATVITESTQPRWDLILDPLIANPFLSY